MAPTAVFVEGGSDKQFVDRLLDHMGIVEVETDIIGGGASHLPTAHPRILRRHDAGQRVGVIVDADTEVEARRREVNDQIRELGLPIEIEDVFLVPNDRDGGDLETLLEDIASDEHRVVHECFARYKACVREANRQRVAAPAGRTDAAYSTPGRKEQMYAYCSVLGIEPRPAQRSYEHGRHWNMEAPILGALKAFLARLVGPERVGGGPRA
ncbi:MAG: hypothetical protein OXH75_26310 [Acidobacteria bacterium]|nr:hypothetical protein [Acidobacteriota bacterium]